jgi:hypothetical protein
VNEHIETFLDGLGGHGKSPGMWVDDDPAVFRGMSSPYVE